MQSKRWTSWFAYTTANPGNFVFNWNPGQPLGEALRQTLSIAYPGVSVNMNISDSLINNYHSPHFCSTFDQLGAFIQEFTYHQFDNPVLMTFQNGSINVFDGTYEPSPIQLAFTDFIGQPTWIDKSQLQIKTVPRADIALGSQITMLQGLQNAPGIVTQSSAALPGALKYKSAFDGQFGVVAMRHVGYFRSSDAANWCTIINCVPPEDFVSTNAVVTGGAQG